MPLRPLLTLALATLAIGTAEFATQGLLLEIATDLRVSVPATGLLVSGYALGVTIGGPILTVLASRIPRKEALLWLMATFVAGNLLCAAAPNYALLMTARVVASFCHGAFFGIGSLVAAGLVPANRQASAVALMWAGIAASTLLGVPAGTALGHAFGWRATFWAIAGLGLAAAAGMALLLPKTPRPRRTSILGEFRVLAQLQVLLALTLTTLICAATFSVHTFIAPLLTGAAGVGPTELPAYLLFFGAGGVIGMQLGGRLADRTLAGSIAGIFAANVAVYLLMPAALRDPGSAKAVVFLWGLAFYAIAAPIQVRVVRLAAGAPSLASTLVQSGFNLGNAIGPLLGGAALSAHFGYRALPYLGAGVAAAGLAVALTSLALQRKEEPAPEPDASLGAALEP